MVWRVRSLVFGAFGMANRRARVRFDRKVRSRRQTCILTLPSGLTHDFQDHFFLVRSQHHRTRMLWRRRGIGDGRRRHIGPNGILQRSLRNQSHGMWSDGFPGDVDLRRLLRQVAHRNANGLSRKRNVLDAFLVQECVPEHNGSFGEEPDNDQRARRAREFR